MDGRGRPTEATWLESIKYRADMSLRRKPPSEPTIFRVPPSMRCGNLPAYKPKLVSIGPYHRGESMNLKAMEELKWRLLHNYLSKVPNGSNNEGLRKMKDLELRARHCYSKVIDLDSDQFVEMLLLDGCFLVQIFMAGVKPRKAEISSLISDDIAKELKSLLDKNMWFRRLIFRDFLLLENQLPYFIIQHLLDTLSMPGWDSSGFPKVASSCFMACWPQDLKDLPEGLLCQQAFEVDHLLDLFHQLITHVRNLEEAINTRNFNKRPLELLCSALSLVINKSRDYLSKVLPCCNNSSLSVPLMTGQTGELPQYSVPTMAEPADQVQSIPTVTELVEAGVKIKAIKEAKSFLNISFCKDKGVLKIPAISVDDHTNFLFANLIAFEQSGSKHGLDVTNYTLFLDAIINTPIDVELLHQEGIIHRDLGCNEDIASLFNKLGNGVSYDPKDNYLGDVLKLRLEGLLPVEMA